MPKGHSSEYSLRLLQRKHDWTTATCSLQLPRDLNPDWSLQVSWWTSVDIKSKTIGVISWKLLWSQVVLRFGWWFSSSHLTWTGHQWTTVNKFKLVLTYLWKVHLRFVFVTPTQCLFPGYVGFSHALMVSEQVPLQDGNCQTCMSSSLSQWGSFQLCAASEPRKRREVQRTLAPAIQGGSWSAKSPTYSTVLAAPADSIASFAQLKWSMPWPNEAHSTVTGEKKLYWKWSDGVWMIYMITNKYEYIICVFS